MKKRAKNYFDLSAENSATPCDDEIEQPPPAFMEHFNPDCVCPPGKRPKKVCRNQPKWKSDMDQQLLYESKTNSLIGYWDVDAEGNRDINLIKF